MFGILSVPGFRKLPFLVLVAKRGEKNEKQRRGERRNRRLLLFSL
jgi:hypothetical protein